ncbi:MAG: HAD family hydrolase [Thermoprotei archaeon]
MTPKCIILDYDGTLSNNETLDHDLLEAIKKTRSNGIRVVIATGRPLDYFPKSLLEAVDGICCEEGGVLLVGGTIKIQTNSYWAQFLGALEKSDVVFAKGDVLVIISQNSLDKIMLLKEYKREEIEIQPYKDLFFLTPKGVNKKSGVKKILEELGINNGIIVVGDELNDIPLMKWATCSIAVRNAKQEIKDIADIVLDEDDGEGIKKLLTMINFQSFSCPENR